MKKTRKEGRLELRLHDEDIERLDAKAVEGGYTYGRNGKGKKPNRSLYVRALLHAEDTPQMDRHMLDELRREFANLTRLGVNLNQLVHHLNEQQFLNRMAGLDKPAKVKADELAQVKKACDGLAKSLPDIQRRLSKILETCTVE